MGAEVWFPVLMCESCGGDAFGSTRCAACTWDDVDDFDQEDELCLCSGCGQYQLVRYLGREHVRGGEVCGEYC